MDAESRILDILGNRNRRRILELLRQKPCFVTEISERLMLSPKAVIEHLQMMEEERILVCSLDERRRKYYYLAKDIDVTIQLRMLGADGREQEGNSRLWNTIVLLRRMVGSRDRLRENLEALERDIELKAEEVYSKCREIFEQQEDAEIVFALAHYDLTREELLEYTGLDPVRFEARVNALIRKGIVEEMENGYTLKGIYASRPV
ncbi:ArsR/SmtB family transcription factor [Methanothrix sp.]|uniref:ArsR/SmtB family transcription factor n=1 Tax=Methanothrix sp. TaxID=90426 RepID=UPI0034E23F8E